VAVAPVLNLSGSKDLDPQRLSDLIASELASFEHVQTIPFSRVLAELESRGKSVAGSAEDAVELGRALGADATLVTAITEYEPYHPPVVGLTMQWYALDAAGAARVTGPADPAGAGARIAPLVQVQRVYNAAEDDVQSDVRDYANDREGHESPWQWRKYIQSQELYVRYCGWATIRTMLRPGPMGPATAGPDRPDQVEQ
jgi:hypothetical protein